MSLPETIWYCEKHDALSSSENGPCHQAHVMAYRAGGNPYKPNRCYKHIVEVELHPVGSRVAGPDDLLIQREDIDYEAALQEWEFDVRRMFDTEGAYDDEGWLLARLTRCIDAALAAAEGEET